MTFYAQLPARRTAQIVADLAVVVWVVVCLVIANGVHVATLELAGPGVELERAGTSLSVNMTAAGDKVSALPVVGDDVRVPFDRSSDAAGTITAAGRSQQAAVAKIARYLGLAVAFLPIVAALYLWLPRRIRFVRRATSTRRLVDSAADLDLFALRALVSQPLTRLAQIHPDPAEAWRREDPAILSALADLELADAGLRRPRTGSVGRA